MLLSARSIEGAVFDERMYTALQEQCAAAARARAKIAKTLQHVQVAEGKLGRGEKSRFSLFGGKTANGTPVLVSYSRF